ncbi:ABA_G0048080.mRNA.1.CDS.1 [Saccharomyces cerevisiae]|nr:ABA_G0048080.mRNA.1.CDS.1 [Saccharomyces cerevisiae]CAI6874194.1 ABA_G0048080.mRNA.1.CDS.1 [Saccharomyces cerevisiae]
MAQEKSKGTRKKNLIIRLCTIRGFLRIYGDKSYTVINTCAAIAQAFYHWVIVLPSTFFNSRGLF